MRIFQTMVASLSQITEKVFSDSITHEELETTLESYKTLVVDSSALDIRDISHTKDIQLENGIAIGLNWAASCLDDSLRTSKFLRGTKQAIEDRLKNQETVHLLYAGTGPFATLILPLADHFSAKQLQLTLLDINPASVENVRKLMKYFGFQGHVQELRCADATTTVFENSSDFDILLSETMQHALQRELQVPITCNLLSQMRSNAILIPQSINLAVVSVSSDNLQEVLWMEEFMQFNAEFVATHPNSASDWYFEKQVNLSDTEISKNDLLAISTQIHVYAEERIEWGESGLTTPKIVGSLNDFRRDEALTIRYSLAPEPGCVVYAGDQFRS